MDINIFMEGIIASLIDSYISGFGKINTKEKYFLFQKRFTEKILIYKFNKKKVNIIYKKIITKKIKYAKI